MVGDKTSSLAKGVQTRQQKRQVMSGTNILMETRLAAINMTIASLNHSMIEAIKSFKDYNIQTNQNLNQVNTQLEYVFAHLAVMEDEMQVHKMQNRSLENRLAMMEEAGGVSVASHMKVPKLHRFNGTWDVKEIEIFIYHLEKCLKVNQIYDDEMKITTTSIFLIDDAMLSWQRWDSDVEKGLCTIDNQDEFKYEMHEQFLPKDP